MVTRWGLSEKLGPLTYREEEGEVFLGHSVTQHKTVSDQTQDLIDEEVRSIIDRNYQRSTKLLKEHEQRLHAMAGALIRYETIDVEQIKDIMEGREPRPPQDSSDQSPPGGDSSVVEDENDGEQSPSGIRLHRRTRESSLTHRTVASRRNRLSLSPMVSRGSEGRRVPGGGGPDR